MDMLTSQLEGCNTPEGISKAIEDIDKFVVTSRELKLNNPKEFRQLFDSVITVDKRVGIVDMDSRFQLGLGGRAHALHADLGTLPADLGVMPP